MTDLIDERTTEASSDPWWKASWPLGMPEWKQLAIAFAIVVAVGASLGFLITDVSPPNTVTEFDTGFTEDVVAERTDVRDEIAHWGAFIADTPVKIGLSVVIAGALLFAYRRWHEAAFIGLTLIFEGAAYTAMSFIVRRPRPEVEQLVTSPVDNSYPSGHTAAATVYAALAVVVFWHSRRTIYRALAVIVSALIPLIVGSARIYQGMHYFSDVVAGMILGAVSIAICLRVMGRPDEVAPRRGGSTGVSVEGVRV